MSRQLEQAQEDRNSRRDKEILIAVAYGLRDAIQHSGVVFTGFSYKDRGPDGLVVVKGVLAGREQVCFVGAEGLGDCLRKATRLGYADKLKWRVDKYARTPTLTDAQF